MAVNVRIQIKGVMDRIRKTMDASISPAQTRILALNLITLIVKRTRLGYGVRNPYGIKERLPTLSARYVRMRRKATQLSATTSPQKSNLTFTGILLESIGIKRIKPGEFVLAPIGQHEPGLSNEDLAKHLKTNAKRHFMNVSELEYKQLLRLYRKSFGDLLDQQKLLR